MHAFAGHNLSDAMRNLTEAMDCIFNASGLGYGEINDAFSSGKRSCCRIEDILEPKAFTEYKVWLDGPSVMGFHEDARIGLVVAEDALLHGVPFHA